MGAFLRPNEKHNPVPVFQVFIPSINNANVTSFVLDRYIEGFAFCPDFQVHYQETVHSTKDRFPKLMVLPTAAGDSSEELPEQNSKV